MNSRRITRGLVGEFTMADSATIPHHLSTSDIETWMSTVAAEDVRSADGTPRVAVDASGRSAQTFLVEVVARRGDAERRIAARGRDIYAVTAPLVVEAALRVRAAPAPGVHTAGALFDPDDFLGALTRHGALMYDRVAGTVRRHLRSTMDSTIHRQL